MQTQITHKGKSFSVDLDEPIDISIPLREGEENVNAYYIPSVQLEPFRFGNFIGDVSQGGSCNVNNIFFNPHGNGTHTECIGHISKENYSINQCLKKFFFIAKLVTISPEEINGDRIITKIQIEAGVRSSEFERHHLANSELRTPNSGLSDSNSELPTPDSLIIRTLPNGNEKLTKKYSGTNPPYIEESAAKWMCENGIDHLLLDVPSVDREDDGGKLLAHHAFWKYPGSTRLNSTITELIYVPSSVNDGIYLLNIQIASFENDASPSKPILFKIIS